MKKLLLIFTFIICSSLSAPSLVYAADDDPCQDPVYKKLKDKDIEKMSEREYKTFERLSGSCNSYKSQSSVADDMSTSWLKTYGIYLGGMLLFLLIL